MAFIGLGQIDRNLFAIIIGCIACFLNRLLNQYKGTILVDCKILTSNYIIIPRIFTLCLYLRVKNSSKSLKKIMMNIEVTKSLDKKNEEIYKGKWSYIMLAAVFFSFKIFLLFLLSKQKQMLGFAIFCYLQ